MQNTLIACKYTVLSLLQVKTIESEEYFRIEPVLFALPPRILYQL